MPHSKEFDRLIESIPKRTDYGESAELHICLPTNSNISPAETIEVIQRNAHKMGWVPDKISVIKTGGYIICDKCKGVLHLHVATKEAHYCMNCGHDNYRRSSKAKIRVIDN